MIRITWPLPWENSTLNTSSHCFFLKYVAIYRDPHSCLSTCVQKSRVLENFYLLFEFEDIENSQYLSIMFHNFRYLATVALHATRYWVTFLRMNCSSFSKFPASPPPIYKITTVMNYVTHYMRHLVDPTSMTTNCIPLQHLGTGTVCPPQSYYHRLC